MDSRKGFTFIEVLMYIAMFAIGASLLVGILFSVTRIQSRENSVVEVTNQSNFVLQTIKRVITDAALIDDASSSLRVRSKASSTDPIHIYISGGVVYIREANGTPVALTDNRVSVSQLTFTPISNPPSRVAVQIDMTMAFNTSSTLKTFSKAFHTAISKVSAATFDSGVLPNSNNSWDLGSTGTRWKDGYFSGTLDVDGGLNVDSDTLYVDNTSNEVGILVSNPQSALQIASSSYIQIGAQNGAPTATDCDNVAELGRLTFDYLNNRIYICDGTGGWRFATTT